MTVTPRQRIEMECARRGKDAVLADCFALLDGSTELERLRSLAAGGADKYLDGREHEDVYWFRVWAMRGLLWAWDPRAEPYVVAGFRDEHWRVREMAAKVTARHLVAGAAEAVVALKADPVPRVRQAAERAIRRLIEAGT